MPRGHLFDDACGNASHFVESMPVSPLLSCGLLFSVPPRKRYLSAVEIGSYGWVLLSVCFYRVAFPEMFVSCDDKTRGTVGSDKRSTVVYYI